MVDLTDVGRKARAASVLMGILDSNAKNDILFAMADALEKNAEAIIYANSRDCLLYTSNKSDGMGCAVAFLSVFG